MPIVQRAFPHNVDSNELTSIDPDRIAASAAFRIDRLNTGKRESQVRRCIE
ncbi:hypothetical protein BURMUCF2_A0387 [Burkholderia multivorans CF2]|nr:hypothetical protein BURMUCF2_A0387 [Burkholderia multivorans CF2]